MKRLDVCYSLAGEAVRNSGEDAYVKAVPEELDRGVIGVFDGLGGSGGKVYPEFGGHTGAYISSRVLAVSVLDWFEKDGELNPEALKEVIQQHLAAIRSRARQKARLIVSASKEFPSTMAAAHIQEEQDITRVTYFWSGDSRGYVLNTEGMHQVTEDDAPEMDAMRSLTEDPAMTNVISASGNYEIHMKQLQLHRRAVILTATDGCFAYLKSPMEFERIILDTLMASESVDEWKLRLWIEFHKRAGDDFTLTAAVMGYGSFAALQDSFRERAKKLASDCPFDAGQEEILQQWETYRRSYELYLKA